MGAFKSFPLVEDLVSTSETHPGDGGEGGAEEEEKVEEVIIGTYRTPRGALSRQGGALKGWKEWPKESLPLNRKARRKVLKASRILEEVHAAEINRHTKSLPDLQGKCYWMAPRPPAVRTDYHQQAGGTPAQFSNEYGTYNRGMERRQGVWVLTGNDSWTPNENRWGQLPAVLKQWLEKKRSKGGVVKESEEVPIRSSPLVRWADTTTQERRYQQRKRNGGFAETMAASDLPGFIPQEEAEFGSGSLKFPVERRPNEFRRKMLTAGSPEFRKWLERFPEMIGDLADTPERQETAVRLLNTWQDVFCEDVRSMPATDLVTHRIPTYKEVIPKKVRQPLYTQEEMKWQRTHFKSLTDAGIIAKCQSPWSAKTRFPRKRDSDKLRMVHAFIPINDATIKAQYTMRRMEPVLHDISQSHIKCLFQADASNGYWAVPLHPEHAYKSAFSSAFGQMCYLRMGQGLTGSPGTYARLKDIATGDIPEPNPEPALSDVSSNTTFNHFVDDDIGGADTFEELVEFLHNHYFPRLLWARLTISPAKSKFFVEKLRILGFTRDNTGIRPSADKLAAMREYPTPVDAPSLERFIYMLPFLRSFIPGRADLTTIMKRAIIDEVTIKVIKGRKTKVRTVVDFVWGPEQQPAFETAKEAILKNTTSGGDPDIQYHLSTDASKFGAGGCLFQLYNTPEGTIMSLDHVDNMRVVMYMSFRFLPPEINYHTTEREALAVLRSLEESRWLVLGAKHPIKVYTDHQALMTTLRADTSSSRIARWQLRLSEYNMEIHHVPGKEMAIADGLSRINGPPAYTVPEDTAEFSLPAFSVEGAMAESTTADDATDELWRQEWADWLGEPWYSRIIEHKKSGEFSGVTNLGQSERRIIQTRAKRFVLIEGDTPELAYRERSGKLSKCLHPGEVQRALEILHNVHGHFSTEITIQRSMGKFWWPTRRQDIEKFCKTCINCQCLGTLRPTQGLLPILHLQPLDCMGIDYIGPFSPIAKSGARFIVIVVDYATRYLWAMSLPVSNSVNTIEFFIRCISNIFGWPRVIYSDNGKHFMGAFDEKLKEMGVKHVWAPVSHPSSVGLAERYVRIVVEGLRAMIMHSAEYLFEWDKFLPYVVNAANTRLIRIFGYSPAHMLFGFDPKFVAGVDTFENEIRSKAVAASVETWIAKGHTMAEAAFEARLASLDEIRRLAIDRVFEEQQNVAEKTERSGHSAQEGDLVLLRRLWKSKQHSYKLSPPFEGPYIVTKVEQHQKSL